MKEILTDCNFGLLTPDAIRAPDMIAATKGNFLENGARNLEVCLSSLPWKTVRANI